MRQLTESKCGRSSDGTPPRKRITILICAFVACTAGPAIGGRTSAHTAAAKSAPTGAQSPVGYITSAYAVMDAAVARRQLDQVFVYCTPDFIQVSPEGRVSTLDDIRTQALAEIQHAQSAASQTRVSKIVVKGECAVVNLEQRIWLTSESEGILQTIDGIETVRDTWICRNRHWMLKKTMVLTEFVTVNGKSVNAD
jgi:hypothetical protein